jgi:hypothetical protein
MRGEYMRKDEAKPLTPYERFVAATKAIVSVTKKDVEKDIRALRKKRKRRE